MTNAEDDDGEAELRPSPCWRNKSICLYLARRARCRIRHFPSNNHHAHCSHRRKAQKALFYRHDLRPWPRYLGRLCLLVSLPAFCGLFITESISRYGVHLKARESAMWPLCATWHSHECASSWATGELLPQARERKSPGCWGIVGRSWGDREAADMYTIRIAYQPHSIYPPEPTQIRFTRKLPQKSAYQYKLGGNINQDP